MAAHRRWVWIDPAVIRAVHEEQLAEHGGAAGVHDEALLESALARPKNLAHYGDPEVAAPAASYAHGLAKNHAFIDGNKRTAFVAAELFLALNSHGRLADDTECVLTMLALASGDLDEPGFAGWLREHIVAD